MKRTVLAGAAVTAFLMAAHLCRAGEAAAPAQPKVRVEFIQAGRVIPGEGTFRWRFTCAGPAHVADGWYGYDGGRIADHHSRVYSIEGDSRETLFDLSVAMTGGGLGYSAAWALHDGGRQVSSIWSIPPAATLRVYCQKTPVDVGDALTPIWKAEFIVNGQTVRTIVWALRIVGEGPGADFLKQSESAEPIRVGNDFQGELVEQVRYSMPSAEDNAAGESQPVQPPAEIIDPVKAEALLKEFHEVYRLDEGEVYKLVMNRRPQEARHAYWIIQYPNAPRYPRDPAGFYFHWLDGKLVALPYAYSGVTIADVIVRPLEIPGSDIEADDAMLSRPVPADVIWRPGVPKEDMIKAMNRAFAEEFVVPLILSFREVESDVYVATGAYRYNPSPFAPPQVGVDTIVIQGSAQGVDTSAPPAGTGSLGDALAAVGNFIGISVVSEVDAPPAKTFAWRFGYRWRDEETLTSPRVLPDGERVSVLRNVTAQTGLTFGRERRKVRKLVVELGEPAGQ